MARPGEQAIKCNVHSCRHNDQTRACVLSDIVVGNDGVGEARHAGDTICSSFAPK